MHPGQRQHILLEQKDTRNGAEQKYSSLRKAERKHCILARNTAVTLKYRQIHYCPDIMPHVTLMYRSLPCTKMRYVINCRKHALGRESELYLRKTKHFFPMHSTY